MGRRSAMPLGPTPCSRIFSPCASVYEGNPARPGARSAQLGSWWTGTIQMGAPCSQREWSSSPFASRGEWHSPHFATSSTRYRPRSTWDSGEACETLRGAMVAFLPPGAVEGVDDGKTAASRIKKHKKIRDVTGVCLRCRFAAGARLRADLELSACGTRPARISRLELTEISLWEPLTSGGGARTLVRAKRGRGSNQGFSPGNFRPRLFPQTL